MTLRVQRTLIVLNGMPCDMLTVIVILLINHLNDLLVTILFEHLIEQPIKSRQNVHCIYENIFIVK